MSAETASINPTSKTASADQKILKDLATLKEKMELCTALLKPDGAGAPAPSFKEPGTPLLDVIGFLEASAPRMVELVEAAAQGALGEDVFASCLEVNDQLQKLLADVETQALTETTASTTAAAAAPPSASVVESQFSDLLLDDDEPNHHDPMSNLKAGTKTTGEEDDDEEDAKKPAAAPTVEGGTKSDDEFDDFFATRTTAGSS